MNENTSNGSNRVSARERQRLRGFEREAREGRKLGSRDRLIAAFHLTRAWNAVNASGLKKMEYQERILAGLHHAHKARQEFRLANWTLKRGEDPRNTDLSIAYQKKTTPQLALEPYLVGIEVAAREVGADPDDWKLDMMRELKVWAYHEGGLDVSPVDDRPSETLAMLISAMCCALGRRNRLQDVFDAVVEMNCRWEMFGDRLVATDAACLQPWQEPIWGAGDYFEESFPFPSVSLVKIPYLEKKARFVVAPEATLAGTEDVKQMLRILPGPDYPRTIPEGAVGCVEGRGHFGWFRDIRLCVLPDGHGGYAAGLQSRPYAEVSFGEGHPLAGRARTVINCFEPDLSRPLFYSNSADGGAVWPHVLSDNGEAWRICLAEFPDPAIDPEDVLIQRDPETTGWQFDLDPVGAPGEVFSEPWYLSYTPATPDYLRHWLCSSWQLGVLSGHCEWRRGGWNTPDDRWNRDLPPIQELNFPDHSAATWIECCLHNGLIEEALQASIDRLKGQVANLQAGWFEARERNAQKLLARWDPRKD